MSDTSYSESARARRKKQAHRLDLPGVTLTPAYVGAADPTLFPGRPYRAGVRTIGNDEAFDRLRDGFLTFAKHYVRVVDRTNQAVGQATMWLLIVMMGILTYAMIANVIIKSPAIWVMEMAQFTMAAYYLLGGGFSFQDDAHVRMDVFRERWGPKTKLVFDLLTDFVLIFYVGVLLTGGISSAQYALEYGQKNYTAWAPPMAPIKIIMTTGILLMLLQAISQLFKDIAALAGKELS